MRRTFCGITSLTFLVIATSSLAQSADYSQSMLRRWDPDAQYRQSNPGVARRPLRINSNFPEVPSAAASLTKGAVHLMVRSDADARQIFTYCPYPWVAAQGYGQYVNICRASASERTIRWTAPFVSEAAALGTSGKLELIRSGLLATPGLDCRYCASGSQRRSMDCE